MNRRLLALTGITAMGTAALAVPLRSALVRTRSLDVPNHRSSHERPVPRSGGLAPLAAAALAASFSDPRLSPATSAAIIGLGAVGLADDVTGHAPAAGRLTAQIAAGAVASHGGPGRLAGGIATAGIVNVTNFMDGINGISGLTAVVWGAHCMSLPRTTPEARTLGALVAGGGLGFLPHNALNARLFLGDVGSYALGAAMATGAIAQPSVRDQIIVATPLLPYACDAAQALIHRARTGQPLGVAHRDHVYQRLVDGGAPHVLVALFHASMASLVAVAARQRGLARVGLIAILCGGYLASPRLAAAFLSRRAAKDGEGIEDPT